MNNAISRALMVLAMAALVGTVGCGDDDVVPAVDSGVDAGGMPRDAGPPMDSGMVVTPDGAVDAGPGMTDGGGGGGMCTSAADVAGLMGSYADGGAVSADGGMGSSFNTIARACGLSCLTATDPEMCMSTCVRTRTGNAVSMGCADCYSGAFVCSATMCTTPCTADPAGAACIACQCGTAACIPTLVACTGIPSTACTPSDGGMPATDAGAAAVDAGPRDAGRD